MMPKLGLVVNMCIFNISDNISVQFLCKNSVNDVFIDPSPLFFLVNALHFLGSYHCYGQQ